MLSLGIKRIYVAASGEDGVRVLVDRLWPRGIGKQAAAVDYWARDIAPSNELRKWYAHDPARWPEFRRRYFAELEANGVAVEALRARLGQERATLLFQSREEELNNAVALLAYLQGAGHVPAKGSTSKDAAGKHAAPKRAAARSAVTRNATTRSATTRSATTKSATTKSVIAKGTVAERAATKPTGAQRPAARTPAPKRATSAATSPRSTAASVILAAPAAKSAAPRKRKPRNA